VEPLLESQKADAWAEAMMAAIAMIFFMMNLQKSGKGLKLVTTCLRGSHCVDGD
jgi:hypothetical protein